MKKFFSITFTICVCCMIGENLKAQTPAIKIGVFDLDMMVQALPEYRNVDSLTANYEQDSLAAEYQNYQNEYQRLDSTYKADSASKRPASVLDYSKNLRQQMAFNLVYWQQISQQKSNNFRGSLAQPLYARVLSAYKKILASRKYAIILKPNSFEVGFPIENMFPLVAKEMNVPLPQGLMIDPNQALQDAGNGTNTNATQQPKPGGTGTRKP